MFLKFCWKDCMQDHGGKLKEKKKVNVITIIIEHACRCLNNAKINRILNMSWVLYMPVLNMAKLWVWQSSQYASITQRTEYTRICLNRVLNISQVLNMPGSWIWQGCEYARATQKSKYATVWLNMSE